MSREALRGIKDFIHYIENSRTESIGSLNNVYVPQIAKTTIDEVKRNIELLESEPTAGEYTKELKREFADVVAVLLPELQDLLDVEKNIWDVFRDSFNEACDRIDQLEAELKAKDEALKEIEDVASGEEQVAIDDTEGMVWIQNRIKALKGL